MRYKKRQNKTNKPSTVCGGFLNELDTGGLAVGAGDTDGLAFSGFDDQKDAAVVSKGLVEFEGEGVTLALDGGGGKVLHTLVGWWYYEESTRRMCILANPTLIKIATFYQGIVQLRAHSMR